MDTPDATVQQQTDFGDVTDFTTLSAERMRFEAGTDIAPLLQGLEDDRCQVPHWGYVLKGALTVTYADETEEVNAAGDLFYWPPGHSVAADEDSEMVLFSPQAEHREVFEHMAAKMDATTQ